MKLQISSLFVACGVAFLCTGCATERHSTAYDYKIIRGTVSDHSSLPPLEKQLQQAAADGWQVVAASGGDVDNAMIILKKRK
jgi:hypothetical protein